MFFFGKKTFLDRSHINIFLQLRSGVPICGICAHSRLYINSPTALQSYPCGRSAQVSANQYQDQVSAHPKNVWCMDNSRFYVVDQRTHVIFVVSIRFLAVLGQRFYSNGSMFPQHTVFLCERTAGCQFSRIKGRFFMMSLIRVQFLFPYERQLHLLVRSVSQVKFYFNDCNFVLFEVPGVCSTC